MNSSLIEQIPVHEQSSEVGKKTPQMIKFEQITSFYEISDYFAQKLLQLQGFEIVIINDDSYSMDTHLKTGGTRWEEQKNMAKIITDIAATMDTDGIDHYFLNKGKFPNIMDGQQAEALFTRTCGGTPLCRTLRQVLADKRGLLREKKLLIIIITDGQPESISDFRSILARERTPIGQVYTTIVACTDDESTMDYLNDWDQAEDIGRLDVVDDYQSEKVEILNKQGQDFPFSFGDYVVKALLGSIDQEIDKLDEVKRCDLPLLPPEPRMTEQISPPRITEQISAPRITEQINVQTETILIQEGYQQIPLNDPVGNSTPPNLKVQSCCVIF